MLKDTRQRAKYMVKREKREKKEKAGKPENGGHPSGRGEGWMLPTQIDAHQCMKQQKLWPRPRDFRHFSLNLVGSLIRR